MITTLNNLPKGQAELTIELTVEELEPYLKKACANISQLTKIPGFRPGSAPYEVVKNQVGEMTLFQEASHLAVRKTLFDAIDEKKLKIIGEPKVEPIKLAPGNSFIYKATLDLLPAVKIGDWSKIKIKKEPVKVEEKEIEKTVASVQEMMAKESLTDKPAVKSDRVEVDFEVSLDKVVIDGGSAKNYSLIIGKDQMIPGFEDQLIGLKKGEEKEFQLKFPDQYHNKMLAGKKADFRVKILSVYQRELPELTDELIKNFGAFGGINEFKERIKEDLIKDKERKNDQEAEREMLEKLIKVSDFEEIPEELAKGETQKMLAEFRQGIEAKGLDFTVYLQNIKKTEADLQTEFSGQAVIRLKASLLLQELAMEKNITVTKEEIQHEIDHLIKDHDLTAEQQDKVNAHDYRHFLENMLKQEKILAELKKDIIN